MYFDVRTYFKAQYYSLFKRRFSIRRWFWTLLFLWLYWTFFIFNNLARFLDHIFFPGFRKQEVKDPIFIVATPRSGTTFTQRLMCLDENRFTYFKLYQTILPAITHYKVIGALAWVDRRIGHILSKILGFFEKKFFGGWEGVHNMGFARAEEDEGLFAFPLLSVGVYLLFPDVAKLREAGFADDMPPKRRRKLMKYYKSCLQRHLYATGSDKILLSKNTLFSGRIESVREAFPDARIIYLVRDPHEVVPSFVSMWYKPWLVHSPDIPKSSPETKALAELTCDYYRHMLEAREHFAPDQFVDFKYADLVTNPRETIEQVYETLGLEMSEDFKARLAEATEQARTYQSSHDYNLEEFGLSAAWIREQLGEVLDAYGFESPKEKEPEDGGGGSSDDKPAAD